VKPRLVFGPLRQHPGRTFVSVAAIALGVALGFAVQTINGSAVAEFAQAARQLAGNADLSVSGAREGFDEAVFAALAGHPAVAVASPVLEVEARLAGRPEALRIVALDALRAGRLQGALVESGADFTDLLAQDTLFLSAEAMAWLRVGRGDVLEFQAGLGRVRLRVAGVLTAGAGRGRLAVMDIAAAQSAFARLGRITRVDLRLAPGADAGALEREVALPPGTAFERPAEAGEATARMTRSYRVNLNVLALVALFTGALLVFSTQALSVARRRAQIALLRVCGVTRAQVLRLVMAEGALLGAAGALLGLLLGAVFTLLALRLVGGDLGAGFFRGVAPAARWDWATAALFGGLGLAAALLGSLGPAREAARTQPSAALKSGDDQRAFAGLRPAWPGLVILAGGAACAFAPPVNGLPLFGYAAIAAGLLGALLLLPRLAALVIGALPPGRSPAARLALARLRAYPVQAAVSLAAVVAAVSLLVSMAVMVFSFRTSLGVWLDAVLPADLYLRSATAGDTAHLSPGHQRAIAAVAGVRRVEFLRWQQVLVDARHPRVTLLARDGAEVDAEQRLPLVSRAARLPAGLPPAWVSEPMAAIHGLAPGDVLELPLAGRAQRFAVAGVWRDYARGNGAVLVDRARYVALTGDALANDAGLWLAPGQSAAPVRAALASVGGGALEFADPGEIRALSLAAFDRTFAVTYALEGAAVLIGLLGLSSAIGTEVLARRREFGMLRHVGFARRQIVRMLAAEGLAVGFAGLLVGSALGFAMSLVLIYVVNVQSFHWGMQLHVPWAALGTFGALMLVLSGLTAVVSGRQALSGDAVRAVREDW
jgi:putative ABC transport system permease protein